MSKIKLIFDNVICDTETGCWNWTKSTREGYGQITIDGVHWTTHRYVATQIFGEIPKGKVVRHTCDNRLCCSPLHLKLGDHKDNWKDSEDKHRESHKAMSRKDGWTVGDTTYESARKASKATGLGMKTLMRNMVNGVFDLITYRNNCKKQGLSPKV